MEEEGERALYLEERVKKLERASISDKFDPYWKAIDVAGLRNRIAALERAVYNCTTDALKEPITAKDVDRWRAIEKAANFAHSYWQSGILGAPDVGSTAMGELKAALMGLRS